MLNSIFYKEWLKTRLAVCLIWTATTGVIAYLLLALRSTIATSGAVETIATMLGRDMIFVNLTQFIPLLAGVCLAVVQWLPEMQNKRIKLTLHLPVSYLKSIGLMLCYGIVCLLAMTVVNLGLLWAVETIWLPAELIRHTLLTMLTWYLGGIAGYLLVSWIILEPVWKMRVAAMCMAGPLLALFYLTPQPETYNRFLPILMFLTGICVLLPYYSIYRFKTGKGL